MIESPANPFGRKSFLFLLFMIIFRTLTNLVILEKFVHVIVKHLGLFVKYGVHFSALNQLILVGIIAS